MVNIIREQIINSYTKETTDKILLQSNTSIFSVRSTEIENNYIAGENIISYHAVVLIDSKIYHADNTNMNHLNCIVGIATISGNTDDTISVKSLGNVYNNNWNLTANKNYFVSTNGDITDSVPSGSGKFLHKIGFTDSTGDNLYTKPVESIILVD